MCGIAGFSLKPNSNRKIALNKLKILSLFNQSRGKDATGFYINESILKSTLEVDEFLEFYTLNETEEESIMMMHARAGSWGYEKTSKQAQPFLIKNDLVITHNGTLKNTSTLCKDYNLDEFKFETDTEILGTLLYDKGVKVLNEYKGTAALAYVYKSDKDVLYLYHGSSKETQNGNLVSERPLYILEASDGIYYSSLEESLKAIMEKGDLKPYSLKHNTIFQIKNGEWQDEIVEIKREDMNIAYVYVPVKTIHPPSRSSSFNKNTSPQNKRLIILETLPKKVIESDEENLVYFHQGRYWVTPRKLAEGPIYIKKGGYISKPEESGSSLRYFWQGVMLNTEGAYKEILRLSMEKEDNWVKQCNKFNFAHRISGFTPYPVTNLGAEAFTLSDDFRNSFYHQAQMCKDINFTPDYSSGRNYKIVNGYLTRISASQREKTLHDNLSELNNSLVKMIESKISTKVSGGDLSIDTFPGIGDYPSKEAFWFYDKIFENLEEASKYIQDNETLALKMFASKVFFMKWNQKPIKEEVDSYIADLIDISIRKGLTLLELIEDKGDKQLLISCYDDAVSSSYNKIDDPLSVTDAEIVIDSETEIKEDTSKKPIINWDDVDTEEDDRENVKDIFGDIINDLENLQTSTFNLMDYQEDMLAQEIASDLFDDINLLCDKLGVIAIAHGDFDNYDKIKNLVETKIDKDE